MSPIEKTVRVGKPEDQDRWRREDMLRMTPNERVRLLVEMQHAYFPELRKPLRRVARMQYTQEAVDE